MTRASRLLAHLVVAAAAATMVALGLWQLSRAREKEALLARYAAAPALAPLAFPPPAPGAADPRFRRAFGTCEAVNATRIASGASREGEPGFVLVAECRAPSGQPMAVELGWSKNPQMQSDWRGGPVRGVVGTDGRDGYKLVLDRPVAGLAASALPSTAGIANNHVSYAVQWFFFALAAIAIYALALRQRAGR